MPGQCCKCTPWPQEARRNLLAALSEDSVCLSSIHAITTLFRRWVAASDELPRHLVPRLLPIKKHVLDLATIEHRIQVHQYGRGNHGSAKQAEAHDTNYECLAVHVGEERHQSARVTICSAQAPRLRARVLLFRFDRDLLNISE